MVNYWTSGCKEQVSILKTEMDDLYLAMKENANEENINKYREKRQEYLYARKQLEKMEEKTSE